MKQLSISNPLVKYFRQNKARQINKWVHYFDIYHQYFTKYRGREITMLEFGVAHGGSLQMWKHYFGKKARIIGVDIDYRCKDLIEKQIEIYIGDQQSRYFLRKLLKKLGPLDVVIDDGGHFMKQQIITFQEIFPAIKKGGTFITEDLHSSYWKQFKGGYRGHGTFIEYVKDLMDQMHAWHSQDPNLIINNITRTLKSIHIYNSIIVFEKDDVKLSHSEKTGSPSFISASESRNLKYHLLKFFKFCMNIHNIYYAYMLPD